jgi:hypothetical protein
MADDKRKTSEDGVCEETAMRRLAGYLSFADGSLSQRGTASESDWLGREQQRRATAYARVRGQL